MSFPAVRMQRYRQTASHRSILAETALTKADLIAPLFINENLSERKAIGKMPGIYQECKASFLDEIQRLSNLGIQSVLLFGIPKQKDDRGFSAFDKEGIITYAIRAIKEDFPEMVVIADCCLCEYTLHGHCGIIWDDKLDNDQTLDVLQKTAIAYAEAGVDVVAPSGMMDGGIHAIRTALDAHGYAMVSVMSYAIKYASQFYGPFREAAGSEDCFKGDRKHHQLAPTQSREAIRDALLDVDEGADYLMVKPAMSYLDIIQRLKEKTLLPIVAYHTSGEYCMIKAAASQGYLTNEYEAFYESLIGIKRAGADLIITYYADEIAKRMP